MQKLLTRWIDLFSLGCFLLPMALVPLLFTAFNTNTIVIKGPLLHWSVVLMAVSLFLRFLFTRQTNHRPYPWLFVVSIAVLWLYLVLSVFWFSPHPRSEHAFLRWTAYLLLALLSIEFACRKKWFHAYLYVTVLVSAVASIYAIFQTFEIDFFYWEPFEWELTNVRRVCSSFGNPDYLASFLVGVIPVTLVLSLQERGWLRAMLFLVWLTEIAALVFSYSRGGWVSTSFVLLVLFSVLAYINWAKKPYLISFHEVLRIGIPIAAVGLVFAVSVWWIKGDALFGALYRIANFGEGQSVTTRSYFYSGALAMWWAKPLTGFGLGMFAVYFPQFRDLELTHLLPFKEYYVEHAHNEFLQILAETGIIGLCIYAFIFLWVSIVIWNFVLRHRERGHLVLLGIWCGILGILFHNMFTVTLRHTPSVFLLWSLAGVAIGYCRRVPVHFKRLRYVSMAMILIPAMAIAPYIAWKTTRYFTGDCLIRASIDTMNETDPAAALSKVRQNVENALVYLHRAKRLYPDHVKIYTQLGWIYNKWSLDYPQADTAYRSLESMQPNFTSTLLNLSINQLQWSELVMDTKLLPQHALVFRPLAVEAIEQAEVWLNRAVEADPYAPDYPMLLGRCYYVKGEFGAAKASFEKSLELAKAFPLYRVQDVVEDCQSYLEKIKKVQSSLNLSEIQSPQ